MKHINIVASIALLASAGVAFAQTTPPPSNVPQAQSICSKGFDAAVSQGKLQGNLNNDEVLKAVDTNNDGRISKTEFDNACAKNLFKRFESNTSG